MNDRSENGAQTLSALIGSRLCHDLVNPLGAIGNGVELIEMTGTARGPELDLVREAIDDAQSRVRFLRIAFGLAGPDQMIGAREAKSTLEAFFSEARLKPDWQSEQDLPRQVVKLLYALCLCAETGLPMGGDVTLSCAPDGSCRVGAQAARIQLEEPLWSVLRYGVSVLDRPMRPSEVQFAVAHLLAEELGVTINFVRTPEGLTITTG